LQVYGLRQAKTDVKIGRVLAQVEAQCDIEREEGPDGQGALDDATVGVCHATEGRNNGLYDGTQVLANRGSASQGKH